MSDDVPAELHWPNEAVAWHEIIGARPDFSVPFSVHVFILHTIEQLRDAVHDPDANGYSCTFDEPDADNVGALIMLTKTDLELAIVAHEAAHITLFHYAKQVGRAGAKRWLGNHPEESAEMIGNLTSLLWYGIPTLNELQDAA